jgi:hypothetical protein
LRIETNILKLYNLEIKLAIDSKKNIVIDQSYLQFPAQMTAMMNEIKMFWNPRKGLNQI